MDNNSVHEFLNNHPKILISLILRWYPIKPEILDETAGKLSKTCWDILSKNKHFSLNVDFLSKYQNHVDWSIISKQQSDDWNADFIETFKERLSWPLLSHNDSISWSCESLKLYSNILLLDVVFSKPNFRWTQDIVETFKNEKGFKWSYVSSNENHFWTEPLIDKYSEKIEWNLLSKNPSLPWSKHLLLRYETKWNWKWISSNSHIKWDVYIFETFLKYFDWNELSRNPSLPWTLSFIRKYKENWNWKIVSENPGLPWSESLIQSLENDIDFESASNNPGIPWTLRTFGKYYSQTNSPWYINWRNLGFQICDLSSIGQIKGLNISKRYLSDFLQGLAYSGSFTWDADALMSLIKWERIGRFNIHDIFFQLSANEKTGWDESLLKKFSKYWLWNWVYNNRGIDWKNINAEGIFRIAHDDGNNICKNPDINWTIDMLDEHEYVFSWGYLLNCTGVWTKVFKDHIDDKYISSMLEKIKIEEYDEMSVIHDFGDNPNFYNIDSILNFGTHKGKSLEEVFRNDPKYIEFCFEKVDYFVMYGYEFDKLKELNPEFSFSQNAINQYSKKLYHFMKQKELEDYYEDLQQRNDDYLDNLDWRDDY